MAVKYYQDSGSGLGGILGGLATLGGILTGQPLLSALGTGLNVMSGGNGAAGALGGALGGESGSMSDIFNNILTGKWKNPASNSIATVNQISDADRAQTIDEWQKAIKTVRGYF